jgi:hypothetical protein
MKFIILFTFCYFAVWSLTKAEVKTENYNRDPSLDNKVSDNQPLAEHPAASVAVCTAVCNGVCACFGFNPQQKKCQIHPSCDLSDMTTDEAGWRYYSPQGMLSHIPHTSKWYSLIKYLKGTVALFLGRGCQNFVIHI